MIILAFLSKLEMGSLDSSEARSLTNTFLLIGLCQPSSSLYLEEILSSLARDPQKNEEPHGILLLNTKPGKESFSFDANILLHEPIHKYPHASFPSHCIPYRIREQCRRAPARCMYTYIYIAGSLLHRRSQSVQVL